MDRADAHERSAWAYNHRSQINDAQWQEMVKKDAALEARVKQLEAEKKGVKDADYMPAQFKDDPDLAYSDEYVDAVYNPEEIEEEGMGVGEWIAIIMIVLFVGGVIFFVFVKKWDY